MLLGTKPNSLDSVCGIDGINKNVNDVKTNPTLGSIKFFILRISRKEKKYLVQKQALRHGIPFFSQKFGNIFF